MHGSRMINYLLPQRAATVETLGHPAAGVIGWFDGNQNNTGVSVTNQSALTFAAVWCATRVIAETIATLPCMLYRRKGDDSRERATDDERYWIVSEEPNPMISAVSFFESQTAQMVLQGNCYAEIVTASGLLSRLEPRMPEKVRLEVDGNNIYYELTDPNGILPASRMLHVAGIGGDGLSGWSVVKYAQQSIGAGIAGDQYAGGQWGNGATPNGVLTHPMRLDKAARETMRREWEEVHKGAGNAGKIAIMHGGMEFKAVSMTNEDAQFLESRQFSIREIARWFRLPPHMLADLADSSVRANIEQQAIEFLTYSLRPWLTRWEQTLNRKLLSKDERRGLYFEFLMESLLRGDSAAQAQAWSVGRQWGWFSVNEIRRQMNLPPVEGGDVYLQPTNMVPADSDMARGEKPEPAPNGFGGPPPEDDEEDESDEVPDSLKQEMQKNLAATLSEIITSGQRMREDLETGTAKLAESMAAAEANTLQAVSGLREIREEIRRDMTTQRPAQVQGWEDGKAALVEACNDLLHSHVKCLQRVEESAVIKAVKTVARGKNFVAWTDWYDEFEQLLAAKIEDVVRCYGKVANPLDNLAGTIAGDYCQSHRRVLLEAADGDPAEFETRVRAVLETWKDEINQLELKEQQHVA